MAKSNRRGLARITAAAGYSLTGLRAAWRHEAAFRQEVALVALLTPAALWLGNTAVQRTLLIGSCLLVLIVELLNSAIEAVVDRVSHDHHELSAQAKDMGSAAVLLSLLLAAATWLMVGWERLSGPGA
jgi:diacylglycerol kinase (ATP)